MDRAARDELEAALRERMERGDLDGATTAALNVYGPEIYGFLMARLRSESDAAEVFSAFSERLWRGLSEFGWQSSVRTWAYTIARNELLRHVRDRGRRQRLMQPLPSSLSQLAERVRSETSLHLKTTTKSKMAELRERLSAEDRELLLLRIDRQLAWPDIARVLHEGEAALDDASYKREAARLRKRFQLLKERLLEMGRREGLLSHE